MNEDHKNIGVIAGILAACLALVVIVVLVAAWRKGALCCKLQPPSDEKNFVRFSSDYGCSLFGSESSTAVGGGGNGGTQTNGNTVSATSVTLGGSDFGGFYYLKWFIIASVN